MRIRRWRASQARALLALLLLAGSAGLVQAQTGGVYDLAWNTIDGGGAAFASGGGYELGGAIGQPDADALTGGSGYSLVGGFWAGVQRLAAPPGHEIFLPLVQRGLP